MPSPFYHSRKFLVILQSSWQLTLGNFPAPRWSPLRWSPLRLPCPYSQEYEERLARLRADYQAEQESRARLEEDITAMRNSYDVKLSTLEENLRKETGGRRPGWPEGRPACFPPHLIN